MGAAYTSLTLGQASRAESGGRPAVCKSHPRGHRLAGALRGRGGVVPAAPSGAGGWRILGHTEFWQVTSRPCQRHSQHHHSRRWEGHGWRSEAPRSCRGACGGTRARAALSCLRGGLLGAETWSSLSPFFLFTVHSPTPALGHPIGPVPCPLSLLPGSLVSPAESVVPDPSHTAAQGPGSLSSTFATLAPPDLVPC